MVGCKYALLNNTNAISKGVLVEQDCYVIRRSEFSLAAAVGFFSRTSVSRFLQLSAAEKLGLNSIATITGPDSILGATN
jgi:hypothetical protein